MRGKRRKPSGSVTSDQPLSPNDMTVWAAATKAPERAPSRLGGLRTIPSHQLVYPRHPAQRGR